ncbi:MAG: class A beta-lactamase-related serine hydrolase [Thermomicrobiales bacterium]|nr:class A beta-lactamase-related serine hydrolase [Thermomicrobiales bacterium]
MNQPNDAARQPARWQPLENYLRTVETYPIRIGIVIQAPGGDRFTYRADERFLAASTIKVPVVVELFRQVDCGERSLKAKHPVTWRDVYLRDGRGGKLGFSDGVELSLRDLMHLIICMSDNNAANTLIDLAGFENVDAAMPELGMHRSELGRYILGRAAYPEEGIPENWTTPTDLCTLFDAILSGRALSRISTEKLIDMLTWQDNVNRIGRHYIDSPYTWGSKTGTTGDDSHDAGFVRGPDGDLVLAVCTTGFPTMADAEAVIGEIGRLAGVACGLLPSDLE